MCYNLVVFSYHRFTPEDHEYVFSRTYKQFRIDLETKDYDWITIDDGHKSMIKACKMMQDKNIRAKLFVTVELICTPGYCTWDDLWKLSKFHDIENHGTVHKNHAEMQEHEIYDSIAKASETIKTMIGRQPRYFVPPYNQYDDRVAHICNSIEIILVKDRTTIKNNSR